MVKGRDAEHVVQTPAGARVLALIDAGNFKLAGLRDGFGPCNPNIPDQRLIYHPMPSIQFSPDGIRFGAHILWGILVSVASVRNPLKLKDATETLFFGPHRRDLHPVLMQFFQKNYDPAKPYWGVMDQFGWYDPNTQTVYRKHRKSKHV
ncbi:hypothetical protein [Paracoccus pantotrophus]|uniref:hypothetical protein n=1 Tax=Paracoccus pantotrophus TaxID=82367 RepID=UPI0035AFFE2E